MISNDMDKYDNGRECREVHWTTGRDAGNSFTTGELCDRTHSGCVENNVSRYGLKQGKISGRQEQRAKKDGEPRESANSSPRPKLKTIVASRVPVEGSHECGECKEDFVLGEDWNRNVEFIEAKSTLYGGRHETMYLFKSDTPGITAAAATISFFGGCLSPHKNATDIMASLLAMSLSGIC